MRAHPTPSNHTNEKTSALRIAKGCSEKPFIVYQMPSTIYKVKDKEKS